MRSAIFYITIGSIIFLSAGGLFIVGKRMSAVQTDINRYQELLAEEYGVEIIVEDRHDSNTEISETSLPAGRQVQDDVVETTSTEAVPIKEEPIEIATLPPSVNLNVPFTSQAPEGNWDQPWQDACEEAAILMLDAYYKGYGLSPLFAKDELQKMVDWETAKGWGGSVEIEKVAEVTAFYTGDDSYQIIEDPSIEDMKQSLAAGNPVLVVANGKMLPNPFFSGEGPEYHALIIRGYANGQFITNDPGTRNGEGFAYTYEDLMAALADWNGGNVVDGRPVVLMK